MGLTADNREADDFTRPTAAEFVRLSHPAFDRLWTTSSGFDMDLMASEASVQSTPVESGSTRRRLPFYSRFSSAHAVGVDVLS